MTDQTKQKKSGYVKKRTEGVINRVWRYKLRPTAPQRDTIDNWLRTECYLYNDCIAYRKRMYQAHKLGLALDAVIIEDLRAAAVLVVGEDRLDSMMRWLVAEYVHGDYSDEVVDPVELAAIGAAIVYTDPWSTLTPDIEPSATVDSENDEKLPRISLWNQRVYLDDLTLFAVDERGRRLSRRELLKRVDTTGLQATLESLLPAIRASIGEIRQIQQDYARQVDGARAIAELDPDDEKKAKALKTAASLHKSVTAGHIPVGDLKKRFVTKPRHEGDPYLSQILYGISAATVHRVDRTFQNFFARLKRGENPGDIKFKSPSRYHCLAGDHYSQGGFKYESGVHEIFCDHCLGEGSFIVREVPCAVCRRAKTGDSTGYLGKNLCNKCHGRKTVLDVPLGLRSQLGAQPLPDIDPMSTGVASKIVRRDATVGLKHGKYPCTLCGGAGKRTEPWAALTVNGIGRIKVDTYRDLPYGAVIKNVSIVRVPNTQWDPVAKRFVDDYYLCISAEIPFTRPVNSGAVIGLSLGLLEFLDSNNRSYAVPRHLNDAQGLIQDLQQRTDGMAKGGMRKRRRMRYLPRVHRAVAEPRQLWHRRRAAELTRVNGRIVVEDIDWRSFLRRPKPNAVGDASSGEPISYGPNGAAEKSRLNQLIVDAAPSAMILALQSAGERNGCEIVLKRIDDNCCSECGAVLEDRPLQSSDFDCSHCGARMSRRLNKAKLLETAGFSEVQG